MLSAASARQVAQDQDCWLKTVSSQIFNNSKNTDFTMSSGNLSQSLISLTVKIILFLMFKLIFKKIQLVLIVCCIITRDH